MRHFLRRERGFLDYTVLILGLALLFWAGCNVDQMPGPEVEQDEQEVLTLDRTNPEVQAVMTLQERVTDDMMSKPGVVGTGTGMTEDGRPAIVVMLVSEEASKAVPAEIEAVPVITLVTGEIKALKGPPGGGGGVDRTARFNRPVPISVSTGHPAITAGTLGCRVKDGAGNVYALSNNHVYADENQAGIGDAVIQPGTFDGGSSPADDIGTLAAFETIVFSTSANNVIDAAIALTTTADVGNSTPSDGYGTPKTTTIKPAVNMKVKKCGRTTDCTKGTISAINATVNVGYSSGTARFINQIVITPGSFSAGGDSGSLIVMDGKGQTKADDRKPVGLLYAGSSFSTIANPIDAVLTRFNVTIDGE